MLVLVNLLLVAALGGGYYLMAGLAPDAPSLLAVVSAIVSGLVACLATYLVLARQHGRVQFMRPAAWPFLLLVFIGTASVILAVNMLMMAQLPGSNLSSGRQVFSIAINMLIVGLASFGLSATISRR